MVSLQDPSMLVLNGRENDGPISPTTIWTMNLFHRYGYLELYQNMSWLSTQLPYADVRRLTRWMIAEVIMAGGESIPVPDYKDPETGIRNRMLLFEDLVEILIECLYHRLKSVEVVIVCDCINVYHDEKRGKDIQYLFDNLSKVVKKVSGDPEMQNLRLVVTSQTTTDIAAGYPNVTLDIPATSEWDVWKSGMPE